ncbi:MAG: hypothetical protein IKL73_06400 [Lachnospiraceae bacterium]|nr:hypothetical protein [Lachnospiraceae bacterium]
MGKKKEIFDIDKAMLEEYPVMQVAEDLIYDKPEYEIMPDIDGIDLDGIISAMAKGDVKELSHCEQTITISCVDTGKTYVVFNWEECYDSNSKWIIIDGLSIGNIVLNYNNRRCIYDCLHIFDKEDVCNILDSLNEKTYGELKSAEIEKFLKLKK